MKNQNLPPRLRAYAATVSARPGMIARISGLMICFALCGLAVPKADAAPDLKGFDARDYGGCYFDVQESSVYWGDQIHVQFEVVNWSGDNAGPFKVRFFLSADSHIDAGDYAFGDISFSSGLNGWYFGGTCNYGVTITLPSYNPVGGASPFYIGMIVDYYNDVSESDEGNNSNQGSAVDMDSLTILTPEPDIQVSDSSPPADDLQLDLGEVAVDGESNSLASATVTIVNQGKASLTIAQNGIFVTNGTHFKVESILSSIQDFISLSSGSRTMAANGQESWVVTLLFDPSVTGVLHDALQIISDDPDEGTVTVALSGNGVPVPDIEIDDPTPPATDLSLDLGEVVNDGVGGRSHTDSFTISNPGSGPLTISQDGISLINGTNFTLLSINSSVQGSIDLSTGAATLAEQNAETWTVNVRFDPVALGHLADGIEIRSDDPDDPVVTVTLTGKGLTWPDVRIADGVDPQSDRAADFGGVHADGAGMQNRLISMLMWNAGEAPLCVASNGIHLGTPAAGFTISGIHDSTGGVIDLSAGPLYLAGSSQETWTIAVIFDPAQTGAASNLLSIISDDPDESTLEVAVSGTGLNEPDISADIPTSETAVAFGYVLDDGPGAVTTSRTVVLRNLGTVPLEVPSNGITLAEASDWNITGIVSSVAGTISLSDGPATIAPTQSETWTVFLCFDPCSTGSLTDRLHVASNDPDEPLLSIELEGTGVQPQITLLSPAVDLGVAAESPYRITWNDADEAGNAMISLFLDDDLDPNSGLIPIASALSEDAEDDYFIWQPSAALAGHWYHVYARIRDRGVTNGDYAAGRVKIENVHSFRLLSPNHTTCRDYAYRYEYNGVVYSGTVSLAQGDNTLNLAAPDGEGGTILHQVHVTLNDSLLAAENYGYDELGRVVTITNSRGIVFDYTYDAVGRLTQVTDSTGGSTEFEYDPAGRLLAMYDDNGATFYGYDDLDRLTNVARSVDDTRGGTDDLTVAYTYDDAGLLTAITYPEGRTVTYTHDPAGRLLALSNTTDGVVVSYDYNYTNGLLQTMTRSDGLRTHFQYDGAGRITNIEHRFTADGSLAARYAYTYDAGGRRTSLTVTTPDTSTPDPSDYTTRMETYTYDALDHLIEVVYSEDATITPDDPTVSYTYDADGNRLTESVNEDGGDPEEIRYYVYGNEDRLLMVTNQAGVVLARYVYDAAGNRVMKVTTNDVTYYEYDARNLLTKVYDATGYVEYAYDGAGRRIACSDSDGTTRYALDIRPAAWQVLGEYDENGDEIRAYTYGLIRVAGCSGPTTSRWWYLSDPLESTRHIYRPGGNLGDEFVYDAFGGLRSGAVTPDGFLFAGEHLDPLTGLIYLRNRCYDPATGMFITKDPMGLSGGINSYLYVKADPVNRVDPLGLADNRDFLDYINDTPRYHGLTTGVGDTRSHAGEGYDFVEHTSTGNPVIDVIPLSLPGVQLASDMIFRFTHPVYSRKDIEWSAHSRGGMFAQSMLDSAYYYGTPGRIGIIGTGHGHAWAEYMNGPRSKAGVVNPGDWIPYLGCDVIGSDSDLHPYVGHEWKVAFDTPGELVVNTARTIWNIATLPFQIVGSIFHGKSHPQSTAQIQPQTQVGGVLINKAAQWIGTNLSDIVGATYDPVSHQVVFLGTNDAAAVKDINLDYFYTAIQAVYGSAVPPYVTLDPPASIYSPWTDLGDGDGVFEPGEAGRFLIYYSPIWVDSNDDLRVRFRMHWSDTQYDFTAFVDAWENTHITAGGRHLMELTITNWDSLPTGVTTSEFRYTQIHLSGKGQDSYYVFTLTNSGPNSFIVDSIHVVPNLQHRRYGGRVDGTRLGWVMYEADRVMKCLGVGKDNLTGEIYDSTTVPVPGYSNLVERSLGTNTVGDARFWFVPNEMTLKKYIDPDAGEASVVFDAASVSLKTESYMRGLPQSPVARAFADHFNAHFGEFAELDWPVLDPDDPTGQTIIHVKIFERLREAMQAVALARFFRDNNIPLDMWWLNSWSPPTASSPKTIPTAYNETTNGTQWVLIYGGVEVNKPNSYTPSPEAEQVAQSVLGQRPDNSGDIDGQVWTASGTPAGDMVAVAASLDKQDQNGNLDFVQADLLFPTPGDTPLALLRCYDSAFAGNEGFGPGWHAVRFALQFSRPSWYDENGLMRDAQTNAIWTDSQGDTRLRSGEIRFVDYARGYMLNFYSSLSLSYAVDNMGNPIISLSGLNTNDLPVFTAGEWADGSTLRQDPDASYGYVLTRPDGTTLRFDYLGHVLSITDRFGLSNIWQYTSTHLLTNIVGAAQRTLAFQYNASNLIASAGGPAGEYILYSYDGQGRLTNALHQRSGDYYSYSYDDDGRICCIVTPSGIRELTASNDLRSRLSLETDEHGNSIKKAFDLDPVTLTRHVVVSNMTSGAAWESEFDSRERLTRLTDPYGKTWRYDYNGDAHLPGLVRPPLPGRKPIEIERNTWDLPVKISDPDNPGANPIVITYNQANLPTVITDVLGRAFLYDYDNHYDPATMNRQLGSRTVGWRFGYESGRLTAVTNPLGAVTRYQRDEFGRVTNIIDATGVGMSITYDQYDRLALVHDPRLAGPIVFTYNDHDQIIRIASPAGTNSYAYDPTNHFLVAITNANGGVVHYTYDPETGDLLCVRRENPGHVDETYYLEYDQMGNVTNVIHPNGQETSFSYDDAGRMLGQSGSDHRPPGPPQLLKSDSAAESHWTNAADHHLTWAAPECDSGIAGYNLAFDGPAQTNINQNTAAAAWLGVSEGIHTVSVRACSRAGLWGPAAVLRLWIDLTPPTISNAHLEIEHSACGNYVVGNTVPITWDGFSDNLAGLDGYYFALADHGGTTNGHTAQSAPANVPGALPDATNTVYLWARDAAGNISASISTNILVLSPDGDLDNDGMCNADEETAATAADDADSLFYLTPNIVPGDAEMEITWFAASNRLYDLLRRDAWLSTTNMDWTVIPGWQGVAGHDADLTYTAGVENAEHTFYRVRVYRP